MSDNVLVLMDRGPGLFSYWRPRDGRPVPADPLAAITEYVFDVLKRMVPLCVNRCGDNDYEIVMYDYVSRKTRYYSAGVRSPL